jgi:hypothetical protein
VEKRIFWTQIYADLTDKKKNLRSSALTLALAGSARVSVLIRMSVEQYSQSSQKSQ